MSTDSKSFRVQIVTPEARIFDGSAEFVELPTTEGQLGIYLGHVRLMIGLGAGEIKVYSAEGVSSFVVLGGYAEIEPMWISVLALFASAEEEKVQIDVACERARVALELAENQPPQQLEDDMARLRVELSRKKKH